MRPVTKAAALVENSDNGPTFEGVNLEAEATVPELKSLLGAIPLRGVLATSQSVSFRIPVCIKYISDPQNKRRGGLACI